MVSANRKRKRGIAVSGIWQPVPLSFLRSRACAELSPHAAKLLLDCLSMLGPNADRNGDISLAPRVMEVRGWSSRKTLGEAVKELEAAGLLFKTRQGTRLDCSLFALALYPLSCELSKLDVRPGCYSTSGWEVAGEGSGKAPTEDTPAHWNHARKTKVDAPLRNEVRRNRSVAEQSKSRDRGEKAPFVPPRNKTPHFSASDRSATGHLSREAIYRERSGERHGYMVGLRLAPIHARAAL